MKTKHAMLGAVAAVLFVISELNVAAADAPAGGADSAADAKAAEFGLAMELRNPLADLVTVPLESNFDFGSGSNRAMIYTLNVQPVIPFELTKDWILVTRTIIPFIHQKAPEPGMGDKTGLSDITQSFFISPRKLVGGWIVGAGPVFLYPSATETALGTGKWGAGPTAAVFRQSGGWTYGVLANHIWSFAGNSNREQVNTTLVDPSLSYTWKNDFAVEFDGESTYDWKQKQWIVPLTVSCSQLVNIGKRPVSFQLGGRYFAERPTGGPDWGIVFTLTLVFPK
ncbi:MAG: transporter [Burkholderiales bacterium]